MTVIHARWFYSGKDEPRQNVEVEVAGGRVVAVRPAQSASTKSPQLAVFPALINCHTHLEFSHIRQPLEPRRRFAEWIETVVASRHQGSPPLDQRLHHGLRESVQGGAGVVAEIATSDEFSADLAATSLPKVVLFREILGLAPEAAADKLRDATNFLNGTSSLDRGLSPHAPYSLHPDLFAGICELAARENVPLMCHLAESPAELQLLRSGDGPLVELFSRWGLWRAAEFPKAMRPFDYLRQLSQAPRALVAHGNLLDETEIDFLAAHPHMSVVYCPRTHAGMQSGVHPWQSMLRRGVNLVLGTDSRASNPDLSMWNELCCLAQQHPDVSAETLLSLATTHAAAALGMSETGELHDGSPANLCVVKLPDAGAGATAHSVFASELQGVMLGGEWAWRSEGFSGAGLREASSEW